MVCEKVGLGLLYVEMLHFLLILYSISIAIHYVLLQMFSFLCYSGSTDVTLHVYLIHALGRQLLLHLLLLHH